LWLHSLKVAQLLRSAACLHTNQSRSYLNHLVFPGGKGGRCVRLTTSPHSRAECHEIWESKPPGTLWATPGLLPDCFTLYFLTLNYSNFPSFEIQPHLRILTFPNWLTVKFHYSPIGPTLKLLNTLFLLAVM